MSKSMAGLLVALLFSPILRVDAADKPKKEKTPMEWKGSFCAVTEPAQVVAKTQEDWDALWKKIAAD
ncbi:MAG TPA: hypothetical protein VMQ63_02295, partial [Stellaceae bacterium]|nr:hypothetical protein [Stellaceae bacterium]